MRSFLYWLVRLTLRPFLAPWVPIPLQRFWGKVAALSVQGPPGFTSTPLQMGTIAARKLVPATARPGHAILYLHGGAYVIGGPASHAKLAAQLGHAARCEVYFVDYRLAPEHPFPAALDDALAAFHWLLGQGFDARQVVIAGDSAGAGLTVATALALRDRKLTLPVALVLLSPWTDLTLGGASHRSHARRDPMLRASWLADSARRYAAGRPLTDPLLSPLFANHAGLPPMLIQVGSEEILLSDAEGLAQRASAAGTAVTLKRFEGLWHDFQVHAGLLPEADRALAEIGAFVETSHAQASG